MKKLFRRFIRKIPPSVKIYYSSLHNYLYGEDELRLLKYLCDKKTVSIDVGANIGVYTFFLRKYSKKCYAFEPNPTVFELLKKTFSSRVIVFPYAVSEKEGTEKLRIPQLNNQDFPGLATVEIKNVLQSFQTKEIEVKTINLDNFPFEKVGFIKIDVEGHEISVLKGATKILERDKPNLLIEIEERHNPGGIIIITSMLKRFGYQGFFYFNEKLNPIEKFNPSIYQNTNNVHFIHGKNKNKIYINNFIFINRAGSSCPKFFI